MSLPWSTKDSKNLKFNILARWKYAKLYERKGSFSNNFSTASSYVKLWGEEEKHLPESWTKNHRIIRFSAETSWWKMTELWTIGEIGVAKLQTGAYIFSFPIPETWGTESNPKITWKYRLCLELVAGNLQRSSGCKQCLDRWIFPFRSNCVRAYWIGSRW